VTTDPKRAAENALWHALEDRRDQVRAAKLWTGRTQLQHQKLYDAHASKRLIDDLVANYEREARTPSSNPVQLAAMAKVMRAQLPILEDVLIRENQPWSPYFSGRAREGLKGVIQRTKDQAAWS
jgi:hypothetical protein